MRKLWNVNVCDVVRTPRGDKGMATSYRVECARCPAHCEAAAGYSGREQEQIVRLFEALDWQHLSRKKWLCPACVRMNLARRKGGEVVALRPPPAPLPEAAPEEESTVSKPETTAQPKAPQGKTPREPAPRELAPRELAPKDLRRVMLRLEEVFDDEKALYVGDWSDERIAQELDLPRASVAQVREQYFGALAPDPEITELRRLLDDLMNKAAGIEARLQRVEDERRRLGG